MLVNVSEQTTSQFAGCAAEFCPFCRRINAFESYVLSRSTKMNSISLDSASYVQHRMYCQSCGIVLLKRNPPYKNREITGKFSLEELVAQTNPHITEKMSERLGQEEIVKSGNIPADLRAKLMAEPFKLVHPLLEDCVKSKPLDTPVVLSIIAGAGIPILLFMAGPMAPRPWNEYLSYVAAGSLVLGLALVVYVVSTGVNRYLRREIYKPMARALKPLDPTPDELHGIIHEISKARYPLTAKISVGELFETMASLRDAD